MNMKRNSNQSGYAGSSPFRDDSAAADAIASGNEIMLDELKEKTSRLLGMTRNVDQTLSNDNAELESLRGSMYRSTDLTSKGREFLSSITNDPTYFGVFKIALLVFTSLCVLYFGSKFLYRIISKK